MLMQFSEKVRETNGDLIKLNELCESQADALANLINAQTTAALVSFHAAIKKEISRIINDSIDSSGKEVIEAFREGAMSTRKERGIL